MDEFCRLQKELITLERDEELARYENFEQSSLKLLESEGVCQRKLIAESRRSTSFGRLLINFKILEETQNVNVQSGDIVAVEQGNTRENKLCTGVVFKVSRQQISVAVDQNGDDDSGRIDTSHNVPCYHLVKLANNVTFKRYETTIFKLLKEDRPWSGSVLAQLLAKMFSNYEGIEAKIPIVREFSEKIEFFNKNLNKSQRQAVEFSLNPDRVVSAIQGPPGTGKTTTVVEILLQLKKMGLKVLCVAPSNIAVDTLLDRLANFIPADGKVVRLGHPARIKVDKEKLIHYSVDSMLEKSDQRGLANDIREELKENLHWREKKVLYDELREREKRAKAEVYNKANIILSTANSAVFDEKLFEKVSGSIFDVVIIDEASQCVEISAMQAIIHGKKLILAGDHKQLPPTIMSDEAAKKGMSITLLERCVNYFGAEVHRMLNVQYRMNEKIMSWSNSKFYENKVVSDVSCKNGFVQDLDVIKFVDTSDCNFEEIKDDAGSVANLFEAEIIRIQVEKLLKIHNLLPQDIGVITPYNHQTQILKKKLPANVEVSTVDGFQGREKLAILLTLVRSNGNKIIGFLKDTRRLNVAVTRAMKHLFVVGDSETVSSGADGCLKDFTEWLKTEVGDKIVNGLEMEYDEEFADGFRELRVSDESVVKNTITNLINNVGMSRNEKTKETKKIERDEKTERALNAALDQVKTFLANDTQETIKFSTNPYIRAKIHDFCDEIGKTLSHKSVTKGSSRVLIVKKLDFKAPIEAPVEELKLQNKFSISNLVQAQFENAEDTNIDDGKSLSVDAKHDKIVENALKCPENHSICEFCIKAIPTENVTLHQVHCEKMQRRRKELAISEEKRAAENKLLAQNKKTTSKSKKKSSKSGQKLGTGKNKPLKPEKEDDIDDLLDSVINDNKLCAEKTCKVKVAIMGLFCPNCRRLFCTAHQQPEVHNCKDKTDRRGMIDNSGVGALKGSTGSYTTVKSRSNQIKTAQLKNKLGKKLDDMETARVGEEKTKKKGKK